MAAEPTSDAARTRRTPIRSALSRPGIARLLVLSVIARLPFGAVTILLVLRTRELGGGYSDAGVVVATFAVVSAATEPFIARLVDRVGQSTVLAGAVPLNLAAFLAAAAIPAAWPIAALAVAGAAIGLTYPQIGGMVRALLIALLEEGDERHAAFSLESGAVELQFVVAPPLLVTVVAGTTSAAVGLVVGGVVAAIGGALFAATPWSRAWRPVERADGAARDRLAASGFAMLVALMLVMGLGFGALEVGTTAFAEHEGHRSLAGVLFALSAVGSLVGAVLSARFGAPRNQGARLAGLLAFQAATTALLALPHGLPLMAALIAFNGLSIAPAVSTIYALAARTVPASRITEGYGWLGLGIMGGSSVGAVIAGALTTETSTAAAFLAPAAIVGLGWLATVRTFGRRWAEPAPS
ncbi:MAG: MFS transporter [Solirubrobacteraceae bacterium]|nr:hypothetical protein [Patulibacter sp.]